MFFSSPPPVVDFVDLKQNQIVFLSDKPLRLGKDMAVRLSLESQLVPLRVYVQQARPVDNGRFAYVATLQSELPFQPRATRTDLAALRQGERLDCHLRVMSPDLPSYSGVSLDFSMTGVQLETHAALEVGRVVRLRLETNMEDIPFIEISARVAWCRPEGRKRHRAGLAFCGVSVDTHIQLEQFERYLRRRGEANLTQLVLECADRYLLNQ